MQLQTISEGKYFWEDLKLCLQRLPFPLKRKLHEMELQEMH